MTMTVTRRQICEIVKHIPDLTKPPNAFMETKQSGQKNREHHTHQTALYFQWVIKCLTKEEMTLQCIVQPALQ